LTVVGRGFVLVIERDCESVVGDAGFVDEL